jgi:putative DNA primase/helicase
MSDPIQQFRDAMRGAGMATDYIPQATGAIERFHINGDKAGKKNGWCVLCLDCVPAGSFGNWSDIEGKWCAKSDKAMTPAERTAHRERIEAMRKGREAEDARRKAEARERACLLWADAYPCAKHAYLVKKGVKANGARLHRESLVLPIRDTAGAVYSLQFIGTNGSKR